MQLTSADKRHPVLSCPGSKVRVSQGNSLVSCLGHDLGLDVHVVLMSLLAAHRLMAPTGTPLAASNDT